jgi:hypothetical protein
MTPPSPDRPTDATPGDGASDPVSGYALFEEAARREAPVPWHAQAPGNAIERMFPAYEGWMLVSRRENTTLNTLIGDALPAERLPTLSFFAFARPGQAAAVIFDPFLPESANQHYGTSARLVYWPYLHPDKRRHLLSQSFNAAIVTPSLPRLLIAVRDRALHDPGPDTRTVWRARSASLLSDVLSHPTLPERDRDALHTMAALGAFDDPY